MPQTCRKSVGTNIVDVFGDFVYVGSNYQRVPSRNVQIQNSTFNRNGRQGIAVVSAEHVLILGNSISNARQAVIDVEPNIREWSVNDLQVMGITLGPRRISVLSASAYGQVANVAFSGNRIVGTMRDIVAAKAAEIRVSSPRICLRMSVGLLVGSTPVIVGFEGRTGSPHRTARPVIDRR